MKQIVQILLCVACLILPVQAVEYTAPPVPEAGLDLMPAETENFGEGLWELLENVFQKLRPDLSKAAQISAQLICGVLTVSLLGNLPGADRFPVDLTGSAAAAVLLLGETNSMIRLAEATVCQLSDYGKLLLPVMTGAMAAQGGVSTSAGLYIGTAVFDSLLGKLLSRIFVPAVYLYLGLAAVGNACGDPLLKRLQDLIKSTLSWCLKTVLTVFTTYMSVTGVVSGTTDAAALKATKVTVSSVVPVVGGILADASEAILVGAGVMKNAAGIYGIFAVLALAMEPFARIGVHYLLLKVTAALCGVFGIRSMTATVEDVSSAMGLLLGITGAMCLLVLISTVCFMKGVS